MFAGRESGGTLRHCTYRDLDRLVGKLTRSLGERLGAARPLAIVMASEVESVAALLAAERAQRPASLIPRSLPPEEMRQILLDCGASLLFVPPSARKMVEGLELGDASADDRVPDARWVVLPTDADGFPPLAEEDVFFCQLTSGSLGVSRFAARTRRGVLAEIRAVVERLRLTRQDRVLCASSIAHSYGLVGGLLASLSVGAQAVLTEGPDGLRRALQHGPAPSVVFGLGPAYRGLLDGAGLSAPLALGNVRFALSAGAPLPGGLFESFHDRYGIPIRQDYGTTETGTISIDAPDKAKPETVGRPLPHLEVRAVPPARIPLEPGEMGEIQVRGEAVAVGYLGPRGLVPCTGPDGWYRTGDAGSLDGSGCLRVGRRLRAPILAGPIEVRPEVVERAIEALPGVREVVALQSFDGPDRALLKVVVVGPNLDEEAIRRWSRARLSPDHRPDAVEMLDQLPRSPAGKVLHKYLQEPPPAGSSESRL